MLKWQWTGDVCGRTGYRWGNKAREEATHWQAQSLTPAARWTTMAEDLHYMEANPAVDELGLMMIVPGWLE